MFTFGREHEKECEARYPKNPDQIPLLLSVVDAVHDLIDGIGTEMALKESIRKAFVEGGAGVWGNAEKWLRKSAVDYPDMLYLWHELASHPRAEVRFKVACCLDMLPSDSYQRLSKHLKNDKSKKVSEMANARIDEVNERSAT